MKTISYGRQEITEDDIKAVVGVLKGDYLTQGPMVEKFENDFSRFIQASNSIAVTNGTAALHLAALALGVREGQKVLVTTNSFAASANCIRYCGADVEFLDIDPQTMCLDLPALEQKLKSAKPGTYSGLVAVDFAGYPMDTESLRNLADQFGLWIIEDACHAVGARFLNSKNEWIFSGNGKYADISVFSFHPVKHIATGEGGMVVTANAELAAKVRLFRTHGITKDPSLMLNPVDGPWSQEMQVLGYNYRISDILCALGASQLQRIQKNLLRRRSIADRYASELGDIKALSLPKVPKNLEHAYHLYVVHTEQRGELFSHLQKNGVNPQVHYIPIHQQPYYQNLYGKMQLPRAEKHYQTALSLPMYHGMSDEEQGHVIKVVRKFYLG